MLGTIFLLALRSIRRHLLRSFLTVLGIVIGTALLQVLQNIVNLLGIPSSLNFAVMGGVILIGVLVDQVLSQRKKSRISKPA